MNSKKSENKIIKYIVIVPVAALVVLSSILMLVVIANQKEHLSQELLKMKTTYIETQKEVIKDRVNQVIGYINYKKSLSKKDVDIIKEELLDRLKVKRFGKNNEYIYIVNSQGILLTHRNEDLIGSDGFGIIDPNNNFYMKDGFFLAKNNGEGYIEYISVTNKGTSWNNEKKLTFVKYYKDFDWAISTGVYISDIDEILEKREKDLANEYTTQNRLLILNTVVITSILVVITMFMARVIASRLNESNILLQNVVDERTKELHENIYFLKKLIDTVPLPIFIKDKDFKYINCNKAFCDLFEKTKKEILGKSAYDIAPKRLAKVYDKKDHEMLTSDKQVYKSELKVYGSNINRIVEFYKVSFKHNDEFGGILGVIIDITEKELVEANLKQKVADKTIESIQKTRQYEEEQLKNIKFTAIGQLAAGITHEINTPLTYIKGNFEMMKFDIDDLDNSDIKNRMLSDSEKIMDGINRISKIVESMREMSQKSTEQYENINIFHTMITALTLLYNRSKQITNIKINDEIFDVSIDKNKEIFVSNIQKQRIEQVWVVILNNALDELVKIDQFEDRLINIKIDSDDDFIVVKVEDNAGGIDENIKENLFEPFMSSKESSGMGVGLNIAKKIIEENKGTIRAYNENKNAVFEIKLPLVEN